MERGKKRGLIYDKRILVTGSSGFFGKNLYPYLEMAYPNADIIYNQGSNFFDLTRPNHVEAMFKSAMVQGPIDMVIHLAAYSGGMFSNMERPASFFYQNLMMVTNMLEACATHKVKRLLIPFGGCSYPSECSSPDGLFKEEDLWNGFPHGNSYGYSMAKKMAVVGGMAYDQQFGLKTITVIPTNPIGPWDNADSKEAHVPMALIGRFLEAKREGYGTVTVYGEPKIERDFISIGDVVSLFPVILEHYKGHGPMNISTGKGTTIGELAEIIARLLNYEGKIHFDKTKASGQKRKVLDNTKLKKFLAENNLGWQPMPLEDVLASTIQWYERRVLGL